MEVIVSGDDIGCGTLIQGTCMYHIAAGNVFNPDEFALGSAICLLHDVVIVP